MIANARMYAVNARVAAAWRGLFEWVIAHAGVECEIVDYPAPQPLPSLWAREDLGCVFMCGYPLARTLPMKTVLAAPVPSPVPYHNAPIYWSDIVVRADSAIRSLDDLFGRRFAFTTEESQSGYQAPRAFFAPHSREHRGKLFAAVVGPLVTPRRVIDAVIDGAADGGPLDSYFHDLIRAHEPELAAQLRTIATTGPTPIPPLVAASEIAAEDVQRLRAALLAVGHAPDLSEVRATLLLTGFAPVPAQRYSELIDRSRGADALGYPRLA